MSITTSRRVASDGSIAVAFTHFLPKLGMNFDDFAGSTVVHSIGGWIALAGGIMLGPRLGRTFKRDGGGPMLPHDLVMGVIGLVLLLTPDLVASAFLDRSVAANLTAFRIAVTLLGILALFQVADGVQVVAIGALRGMGDTARPMLLAQVGYWLIGLPLGWLLGFRLGLGAPGLWIALAAALAAVAAMMSTRFLLITRRMAGGGFER